MADWSLPTLTDLYTDFRQFISDRLNDAAKMFDSAATTPTNQPVGTKRWNSTANKFEKWDGSAWSDLASTYGISISGNAATATTAATATNVTTVTSANVIAGLGYTPANIASPTFTGLPKAPTAAAGTNTTQLATTAFVAALGALKAPVASPSFTGTAYFAGPILNTQGAMRLQGLGGDVLQGVIYFGNADSYIYKNASGFQLKFDGVGVALVNKGGTVAMTSDIPAAGVSLDQGANNVGAFCLCEDTSNSTLFAGSTISGASLRPTNAAGSINSGARSGTWRCLGASGSANNITLYQRIA